VLNAFTVDVEDYFQVTSFERVIPRSQWSELESRVVANTNRLLELLDRHSTQGTFFVLGWVADRFPRLVREIHACGHELACHSYWHHLIYQRSRNSFADRAANRQLRMQPDRAFPPTASELFHHAGFAVGADILAEGFS
jgi:hypothetical protein